MITIGVRELKSCLGECIDLVREGNEGHVTHRGETVAEICPPSHLADHGIDNKLRRRAQAEKVRLGARNRPEVYTSTSVQLPDEIVRALLTESRGEH